MGDALSWAYSCPFPPSRSEKQADDGSRHQSAAGMQAGCRLARVFNVLNVLYVLHLTEEYSIQYYPYSTTFSYYSRE